VPGSSLEHFRLVPVAGSTLGLERAVISVWVPVPPLLASCAAPLLASRAAPFAGPGVSSGDAESFAGPGCSSGDAGSFARRLVAPRSSVLTTHLTPIEFSVVSRMGAVCRTYHGYCSTLRGELYRGFYSRERSSYSWLSIGDGCISWYNNSLRQETVFIVR
jgi:hypothetical protein